MAEKLNKLKAFRIPPLCPHGSPMSGLDSLGPSHIWWSAIESERAPEAFRAGLQGKTDYPPPVFW